MGYRLKKDKEKYLIQAEQITKIDFNGFGKGKSKTLNARFTVSVERLEEAGVLDLWFDKVYKESFKPKPGDVVISRTPYGNTATLCKNGYFIGRFCETDSHDPKHRIKVCSSMYPNYISTFSWAYTMEVPSNDDILELMIAEFTEETGIKLGSSIRTQGGDTHEVVEFFLAQKSTKLKYGKWSAQTSDYFDENPDEDYQLCIKIPNGGTVRVDLTSLIVKLPFGDHTVSVSKSGESIVIDCADVRGTLEELTKLYEYLKPAAGKFTFGGELLKHVSFEGSTYWDDSCETSAPTELTVGDITGTWEEFKAVYNAAKELE